MDEVLRIAKYIRSCREAGMDCTITIDKSTTHLILNALEKSIAKRPTKVKWIKFAGCEKPDYASGECPCCKADVDTDDDMNVCGECGQKLDW